MKVIKFGIILSSLIVSACGQNDPVKVGLSRGVYQYPATQYSTVEIPAVNLHLFALEDGVVVQDIKVIQAKDNCGFEFNYDVETAPVLNEGEKQIIQLFREGGGYCDFNKVEITTNKGKMIYERSKNRSTKQTQRDEFASMVFTNPYTGVPDSILQFKYLGERTWFDGITVNDGKCSVSYSDDLYSNYISNGFERKFYPKDAFNMPCVIQSVTFHTSEGATTHLY